MEDSYEPNIEQLLSQELSKLKKAIEYIDDAKNVAADSTKLLEKINYEKSLLENTKIEIFNKVDDFEAKVNKINNDANFKSDKLNTFINEKFFKLNNKIESVSNEHIKASIVTNNKILEDKLDSLWQSLNNEFNKKTDTLNVLLNSNKINLDNKIRHIAILAIVSFFASISAVFFSFYSDEIINYLNAVYLKLF